jgi:5-amino-6-(5-phospho-D-ribitylamino)uracil phosphatase
VRKSGCGVALCTGRACDSTLKVINMLGLDGYHVFFDGALVSSYDLSDNIYFAPIDKQVLRKFIDSTFQVDLRLELYSLTNSYVDRENWITELQNNYFGLKFKLIDFKNDLPPEDIIKGGMVSTSSHQEETIHQISRNFDVDLYFSWAKTPAYPEMNFINITRSGVSKGNAINALMNHLNITPDQVLAIGDGTNDVSLLSAAGYSVAMQNAPEELKEIADHITADVDSSGVSQALDKFILNPIS